ncbi:lactosylceramide alpha-2,3-sialyltransferase [Discoglossus pictus]
MKRPPCKHCRRVFLRYCTVALLVFCVIYIYKRRFLHETCNVQNVENDNIQRVQLFAKQVLQSECRVDFAKTKMDQVFRTKYNKDLSSFVTKNNYFNESVHQYNPPFGFRQYLKEIGELLELMPEDDLPKGLQAKPCKKCIVLGNGGILHGLHLGEMIDQFDISMWNRLFFWKSVTDKIPLKPNQFRILNPLVIKETAFDILQYPDLESKWLVWNKNVPTIGVTAVIMATHLCDEVSLAGFGYDLSQPYTPLHYYDDLCMDEMNMQFSHDVSEEKMLLQRLIKEGIIRDLTGGIQCSFCDHGQEER